MKKYYEIQVIDEEAFGDTDLAEKLRDIKFPGTFSGWLGGKIVVKMFGLFIRFLHKAWNKKVMENPSAIEKMPQKFPKLVLMKVYEDYDKIMREKV